MHLTSILWYLCAELDDWDVIAPTDIPQHRISSLLDKNSLLGTITSNISSQVGRTMSSMQRAMGKLMPSLVMQWVSELECSCSVFALGIFFFSNPRDISKVAKVVHGTRSVSQSNRSDAQLSVYYY